MNITNCLILSAMLFTIGAVGVIVKKNVIAALLCLELMLNGVNLSFVAFSKYLNQETGRIVVFLVMVVAAAEAAIGLAIALNLQRTRKSLNVDDADLMKW